MFLGNFAVQNHDYATLHALAADTRESLEAEAEAEAGSDAVAAAEPVHAAASAREPRDV